MSLNNFFIYSHFDFSKKSAGATRMLYYARILADKSNAVYLTTCCKDKLEEADFEELEPNIHIHKRKTPTSNFFYILGFVRHLFLFASKKEGTKIFIFYPFPLVTLEIASLVYLKFYKKRPVFYELNEIRKHTSAFHAPLSIKNLTYSFKKIVFKSVFTAMEPLLYFYDGLICISTAIQEYGTSFNKNTIRIPILTDPDLKVAISDTSYSKKGVFNIGFSGSIHPTKENLEAFIKVLLRVNENHPLSFNLCGSVDKKHYNKIFKSDITRYYGNLDEKELATFLSQQDLLVIPRGYSLQNHFGFSTKLSDYLNHQKLILLTDISDNKLFIQDGVNGFIVPPNDQGAMFDKIVHIIQNFDALQHQVLPNALQTSRDQFYYKNFKVPLGEFLTHKR